MTPEEIKVVLERHKKWWADDSAGSRAYLQGADLQEADLQEADLRKAYLQGAYLRGANLQGANLQEACLQGADLQWADLRGANLQGADLQGANLRGAYLRSAYLQGADLRGADLDYTSWPLYCGSKGVKVDARIAQQLAAHLCAVVCDDPGFLAAREALLPFAQLSHRAKDLGLLEEGSGT